MSAREKFELVLIVLATAACAMSRHWLAGSLSAGDIVLYASILLLAQGLIRDLWIKFSSPKRQHDPKAIEPLRSMCMESMVGVLGVVIGLILVFASSTRKLALPFWFWPALVGGVSLTGFLIKDLVVDFRTWTIRREKDHMNIVFW